MIFLGRQNECVLGQVWFGPFLDFLGLEHSVAVSARNVGNEKWNEPEKNHPAGGFL